jgi:hypothetical protein
MTINNPITLTASEPATVLGLTPSTLAKARLSGNGPAYCKLGPQVVYRREDLDAYSPGIPRTRGAACQNLTGQQPG